MSTSDQLRTYAQMVAALEFIQLGEKLISGSLAGNSGINRALQRLSRNSDALLDVVQSARNQLIVGGGTLSWAHGSGAFTRSSDVVILMANEVGSATVNTIPSATSITLATDGSVAYVQLDREANGPVAAVGVVASIADFLAVIDGNNDRLDYQLLAYRNGDTLVLWDGRRILTGESLTGNGATDTQYGQQSEVTLIRKNQRENLQLILHGGGNLSWDVGTETLTWSQDLLIAFPSYAGENRLPAGSLVLASGEFAALTLTREPGSSVDVSGTLSSVADGSVSLVDDTFILAYHDASDGRVYLWDGTALSDGDSRPLGGALSGVQFFYRATPVGGVQVEDLTEGGSYPARSYDVGTGALMVYRNGVKAKASEAYWLQAGLGYPSGGSLVGSLSAGDDYVEVDEGDGTGNKIIWLADGQAVSEPLYHATGTHTIPKTWPASTEYIEAFVGLQGEGSGTATVGIYPEPGGGPIEGTVHLKAGSNITLAYDLPNNAITISTTSVSTPIVTINTTPRPVTTGDVNGTIFAADTSAAPISMDLEAAPAQDRRLTFKNMGVNDLTIGRNGKNIEAAASDYVLGYLEAATLVYDSALGWLVL